jgi:hypothetical protein
MWTKWQFGQYHCPQHISQRNSDSDTLMFILIDGTIICQREGYNIVNKLIVVLLPWRAAGSETKTFWRQWIGFY